MADTVTPAKDGEIVFAKIMRALGKHNLGELKHRLWTSNGAPAVDAGSQASYPVEVGDLCMRQSNSYPYVCTVAPTANTAATFVAMKA
jgi:hypothetical protein